MGNWFIAIGEGEMTNLDELTGITNASIARQCIENLSNPIPGVFLAILREGGLIIESPEEEAVPGAVDDGQVDDTVAIQANIDLNPELPDVSTTRHPWWGTTRSIDQSNRPPITLAQMEEVFRQIDDRVAISTKTQSVQLNDGTEVEVPIDELRHLYQRQADYTRRTQEIARRQSSQVTEEDAIVFTQEGETPLAYGKTKLFTDDDFDKLIEDIEGLV